MNGVNKVLTVMKEVKRVVIGKDNVIELVMAT